MKLRKIRMIGITTVLAIATLSACGAKDDRNNETQDHVNIENAQKEDVQETQENTSADTENVSESSEQQNADVQEAVSYDVIPMDGEIKNYDSIITIGDKGFELFAYRESVGEEYANNITEFADSVQGKANVYNIIVPLSSSITLPDEAKSQIKSSDQKEAIDHIISHMGSSVKEVPIYDTLMRHRAEYVYFRTDHHWTALGAYYAYEQFCKAKGVEPEQIDSYESKSFDGFLGTFYNDSKDSMLGENPDTVVAYLPHSSTTMHVTPSNGEEYDWNVIFDVSSYQPINKYSTFIAGDNPFTVIQNQELSDGSSCVVVKESFGNAFVPFLVDEYQTIYVVDYRYWTGSLKQLIDEKGIQDVIFVNNLSMIRNKYLVGQLKGIF